MPLSSMRAVDYVVALQQRGRDGENVLVYVRDLLIEAHQSAGSDLHLEGRQLRELLHVVLVQGGALLDLDGIKRLIFFDDQIDLAGVALLGSEVEDRRFHSGVGVALQYLGDAPRLEKVSGSRTGCEDFRRFPVGEERHQSGVEEIQLGRGDHRRGTVVFVRIDEPRDVAGLQNAHILFRGRHADAGIAREIRIVEHLPGARRSGFQETVEDAEVGDLSEFTHVPLKIGLDVRLKERRPVFVGLRGTAELRVRTEPKTVKELRWCLRRHPLRRKLLRKKRHGVRSGNLPVGETKQIEDPDAPGKRLRHALHQLEFL